MIVSRWAQTLDKDGSFWKHGRGSVTLRQKEYPRTIQEEREKPGWEVEAAAEWAYQFKPKRWSLGGKLSTIGEETVDLHLHLGPASWYTRLDVDRPDGRMVRLPGFRGEARLDDMALSWRIGDIPLDSRAEKAAGWRHRYYGWWKVKQKIYGKPVNRSEKIDSWRSFVPLPGGFEAPVVHVLERVVRQKGTRWPWDRPKVEWLVETKIPDGEKSKLTFPGKGENSYDCGQDGLYGFCTVVGSGLEKPRREKAEAKAVADALGRVLDYRVRYGTSMYDAG